MKRRVLSFIIALTLCLNLCPVQAFAADGETGDGLCPHHPAHTDECGYVPESPDAPCTFACQICPVEDLIGKLPGSVSEDNSEQVQAQLSEIYSLYDGLTADEQQQVDLAPCISLWEQLNGTGPATLSDDSDIITSSDGSYKLIKDYVDPAPPFEVSSLVKFDTNGYTYTGAGSAAVRVYGTGKLYLAGVVVAPGGIGVEVQSGGFLSITEPGTSITGVDCALNIASGAEVHLSAGSYSAKGTAIRTADGNLSALLEPGYACLDVNGNLLLPAAAAKAKIIVINQCSSHPGKTCAHNSGTTTHTWTCPYCTMEEAEATEVCTFTFDQNGNGTCSSCGNVLTIAVNEDGLADLVYDGTLKPGSPPPITVTLTDGSGMVLEKDTDYQVDYRPRTDAGEITVTVTGITFNGTFIKTYYVEQAQPGIKWDNTTCAVDYDGLPVDNLPNITINIPEAGEDLHPYLQYFHRKDGETEFTPGLPTNAGTYEVKAYLPESQNYKEAETNPYLTLTINKIPAVTTAPIAKTLTYNREAQELVTAGVLQPGAAAEGAQIEFKLGTDGTYSTDIPTGVGVSSYSVYYRVGETENYSGVLETLVKNPNTTYPSARINHKEITPVVELEYYTTLYTGGDKEPKFTVKDGDYVIPGSEYTFKYENNRNVGTATLTIANAGNGNYKLGTATATFQITNKPQDSLTITQKPNTVIYGDTFTLGTQGGSGNGDVTWKIASGDAATVDERSGQVTVTGHGSVTVQATKSGEDPTTHVINYDDATASWTFSAGLRPVTATVTAEDKSYGETYGGSDLKAAKVHAVVEQGILPGDEIIITGLTGTFDDENAGTNKNVTVTIPDSVTITGRNSEHYAVTYSSTTVKATIHKAVVHITTAPDAANLTYNGEAQALIDDSVLVVDTAGVQVEYALSEGGPYFPAIPEGTNAGAYTVWYRVQETDNYTGLAPAKVDVTISKKPVMPTITLSGDGLKDEGSGPFFIYDGNAKEPAVTLTETDGTIPADQYTVSYSNNINVGTTATVTVTAKADGNYTFTNAPVTATFEIKKEQAKVLTAPEAAGEPLTFKNYAQKLVTAGTGSGGKMVYSLDKEDEDSYSETIPTGTDAKVYTVYYKVAGDGNHSDSDVGSVTVTIAPKRVDNPTIELLDGDENPLVSYTYDGTAKTPTVVVKDGSTVIDADEYSVVYSDNIDAGRGTVSITDKPGGNYTVTGSAAFVIVRADIEFNPAPSAAAITYDGKPHELLIPGTTSGGEVLYALNSPTSTYTSAIPTATQAGDYTVYYKVTGDKNHNDLAVQSVPVTIQRKPLTAATIELLPESFAYDGTVKLPEVAVWDEKTLLSEEEYSWSCDVASPTNVGTYTITISDAEGGNYDLNGITAKTATFTIGQIPQDALVIGGKPAVTNYGDSFRLTVSGGAGNGAVTWKATGSATVDTNGNVTITDVGEVTVTVEKAADTNHLAAEAEWTFTAAPMSIEASVTVASRDYDGTTDATVISAGIDAINGDTVTIDPASITAAFDTPAAGTGKAVTLDTSKVKVTGDDAAKYTISYPDTVTAAITQATTTITKTPEGITGLTYNGQPQALVTAGETNVGFIVYSLDGTNFSPEIPTGTDAGDYTVYYKVDGTADYTGVAANTTPVTVTIAPKPITPVIELSESSYLYDGTKKTPKVTVRDDKTVIDEEQYTVTWAGTKNQTDAEMLTVADTYTATIKNVDNGNYTFSKTVTVEVVAAAQDALSITGKPDHVYYGDTITTLGTTGGSGNGTVTWRITAGRTNSTIDPDSGELAVKDIGSITVKAERTVPNYATVSDTWTFTVEPKAVTAEVTVADKVYDGKNTATVTSAVVNDLVDGGDTITIAGLTATFEDTNVGTNKTVTLDRSDPGFTITCDTNKYAVSIPATAQADITPRAVTVSVTLSDHDLQTDGDGKQYYIFDNNEKRPAVTVTGSDETGYSAALVASDYTVSYANNRNAGTNATVTVTASAGGNYTFADKKVTFQIRNGAAVLTATPQAKDLTYDGTAQDLVTVGTASGGTVVYSSTGAAGSYSETIPQETNAGTYTVYYMVKGDANHDDTAPGQVSVTIKSKEITPKITLNPTSYVYDGFAKEPTVTVEDDSDTVTASEYTVTYRDNTNAGTATVIVSDNNGGNYIVNGTASFEITKKAPDVTAPEEKIGLQYSGAPQELVKAGVSGDGTVVYSVNGGNFSAAIPTATAVGDYEITYKVLGDANHSDTVPVTLDKVTIAKNSVTSPAISLSSDTFQYNGSQQKPTITVYDDNGLLIPEHEYTVAITGVKSNNMIDVDTYTVTVTTPNSSNYVITTGNTRPFAIVPANQETISITGTQAQVRYGDTIQLGITGGTGSGTVTWTVKDADGNAVNSTISATGLLTVKDVGGPITVTAKRFAGDNYTEVSATWEFSAAKKQVTAVVTADDRPYAANDKTATVHASIPDGQLVSGDSITIEDVTGAFDDPNVGANKKVTVDSSKASASADSINADKYEITYPATTTASILAAAATVDTDPTPNTLTYDASQAQALVTAGTVTGGIMVYSLDGTNFTPSVPKAKDADTYTVYFKAQGDGNHTDSAVKSVPVTIGKQNVTPQIELTPSSAKYDGKEYKPTVTLRDSKNNVIPASEYNVTYVTDGGANWTDKGDYTVKIEDIDGGNYVVAPATAPFNISTTAQNPLEITNKPGLVYYGDTFTLSAVGGSGNAAVTWSVDDAGKSVVQIDNNGLVKIVGTGSATITATKPGGTNYDTVTATYPLNALKKQITAIVTADDKVYDGNTPATATIHVTWNGLVGNDTISTDALSGTFDDPNAGQDKTVTITGGPISDTKYEVTIPATTTASILKAATTVPAVMANDREYDGTAQPLVTGGNANTTVYSDTREGVYSATVPTGTDAGTYTVWYKELGDANHNDSEPQAKTVTISRKELTAADMTITLSGNDLQTDNSATPPVYSYTYDGTEKKPTVTIVDGSAVVPANEYTVSYSNNKNVSTGTDKATVTITSNEGGNYTFDEQTVNFEITSAAAQLTSSPQAKDLTYTGQAQELVTVGTATGGHIEYSVDGGAYSKSIPTADNAGTYTVTYKVVGEGNYASNDDTWTVSVTIKPKEIISPKVTVSGTYTYDGNPQKPADNAVTVEDGTTPIPASEYTVTFRDNVNAGTATAVITNANGGNYIVNGTGTFIIAKADASVETPPTGKTGLPYNGAAQALATVGSASGGTMVYSLSQTGEYSPAIPAQAAVGDYTVWYKVQGDGNHNDTTPQSVAASIIKNAVDNPTVQVAPEAVTYNGKKQEPTIIIMDDSGLVIDGSEYTVTYADANNNGNSDLTQVGTYTLTIAGKADGNYSFTATGTFKILPADQTPLTITGTRERVCYGDTIQLGTTGGNGTVSWKVDNSSVATMTNGLLSITGVGSVTVTATSSAPGYADQTATWSFYAEKKPVTAVVTAAAKTYDGNATAAVTAVLQSSDLVSGDTVKIKLSGSFEDPNAGTDKKVTVDSTNPDFTGSTGNYGNYSITYPATTTASIFKANVTDVTAPTAKANLEYTGIAQALVTAGSSTEGTLEYSTDGISYSAGLPTGTDADSYDVWYRVKGDGNHNDTEGTKLTETAKVTIAQQEVKTPTIELAPTGVSYDGAVHKPTVVVKDNNARIIPDSEYTVTYDSSKNWKDVGKYTVTITDVDDGNYSITEKNVEFEILIMGQSPLTITNQPGAVRYGDTFTLSTTGGSGTGAVSWVSSNPEVASIDQNGLVKVHKSGSVKITATKLADGNYGATTAAWTFSVEKKLVKAIVTAKDKVFDTTDKAELVITWKDGDLLGNDTIDLTLTGTFDSADVGTNKTVTISLNGAAPTSDKYEISWNTTTTASITPKTATVTNVTAKTGLEYTGKAQELVNKGAATGGNTAYSLDGVSYTLNVPKATDAGTYTVWYKVRANDGNYRDSAETKVSVTIDPKTVSSPVIELSPETFDYDGTAKKPDVVVKDGTVVIPAGEYEVSYSNNIQAGTSAKVTISDAPDGNYIVSGAKNFTIKSGAAVLTLAPQEKELTYNGRAQALVTAGTAVNGKVMYSLDGSEPYSTTIPKGTDAGDYDVYYKVVGNTGYSDTDPEYVTVTIAPKQVTPTIQVGGVPSYSTPYTGSVLTPNVTVIVDGKQLTYLTDYYLVYSNNTNPGTATVTVQSMSTSNYQFYATATFEITKAKATFLMEPEAKTGLVYTGEAQELVEWGMGQDGATVVYSLNGGAFYPFVPTATEVGNYVVSAKVQGDEFYADSDVKSYRVSISRNTIAEEKLSVTLSADSLKYTGGELKPTVTVRDVENSVIISASEYSVTYANNINVGQADVTVTSTTKNYSFSKTAHFTITDPDAPALTITGKPDTVYYGDTLRLGATGGSGTVTWRVESGNAELLGDGRFKIIGSGSITVKATDGSSSDTWTFYADPKPVTAVVTAADKPYDSNTTVTLAVTVSGLVSGDSIGSDSVTASGYFVDANAGTNKTVIITGLTVSKGVSEKYDISYPATTTASITPAPATVSEAPKKVTQSLIYNGSAQALVTAGTAVNGNMMYSLDGINYSYDIPTGTDAKTYTVWYKAVAIDENHRDSAPAKVTDAAIGVNTDNPSVICVPDTFQYDSMAKTPTVVVRDSAQRIIPESEYTATIPTAIAVGNYTVTVTDKPGGNYQFSGSVTGNFEIVAASQNPLSIVTDKPADVYYGDTFRLSAMGGSGDGAIVWSIPESNKDVARISSNGVVTVTGTGGFTVEAYREAKDGYKQSNTVSLPFEAHPKSVSPIVTADDKPYDGGKAATLHAVWKPGDLVKGDTIALTVEGEFATADAGTNKTVTITKTEPVGDSGNYLITWPESTTASIYKVDAKLNTAPGAVPNLTFTGTAQALVTGGTTVGNIGTIVYSASQNGAYSENIPTGTNAGTYTVWYKVADSVNYTGIPAAAVEVEIAKAKPSVNTAPTASGTAGQKLSDIPFSKGGATDVPGKFAWADGSIKAENGKSYDVIFTPDDTANYAPVTIKVVATGQAATSSPSSTPSSRPGTSGTLGTSAAPTQTTVQNGTASTVVSAADGNRLVREAVANQSRNVVIKPEISGGVTKAEVSIPSSTVSQLSSATDAALTVSSPVADVTIPNGALDTLSQAGGAVSVVTEQVEQSVVVTLAAGGETVEQVPGGVTLAVPVEDAGPGTVAVLVHDDGTRETVRKSVVEDGVMSIPLSGSATVEIVDNSKDFDDVPPESWAADAVDFASSHELFSGTSETTFSPDEAMSRGMLATVLYRLEGDPELDLTDAFLDVSSDAWYAEGVAWAAENGIASGYGDGQFGPNDNITREQFVVMLWRYAGSPKAGSQALDFVDADQVSSFALEALCWAVENGILHGVGDGMLDPSGMATRAQAAQLLKNFMENT